MPETTVFECANIKCAYAIDSEGLNTLQLKVLRRGSKRCPKCNELTTWLEQTTLLNTKTLIDTTYGGSNYAKTISNTGTDLPTSPSRRRKQARHDGRH